jgi:hypothetical protein
MGLKMLPRVSSGRGFFKSALLSGFAFAALTAAVTVVPILGATPARASTIDWTIWSSNTTGTTTGGLGVTYAGELSGFNNIPSWMPVSTFSGGNVGNPPPQSGGIIQLVGGGSTVDTITFDNAVTNPVMAIWSLGQSGNTATFNFGQPFAIQSGGPSAEYNGQAITSSGDIVSGTEGNGTIQFLGTFTSISWTNPTSENWYGFTVGAVHTPLPAALPLFATGLGAMGLLGWRRKRKKNAAALAAA